MIFFIDNTENLRPEAYAVAAYIQQELKLNLYILSGDMQTTVNTVGRVLDIPPENLFGEIDAINK
jgi:hypothetical protein